MFEDQDQSLDEGAPVELYRFTVGTLEYKYCSGLYAREGYTPAPISRSEQVDSTSLEKTTMRVRMPRTLAFVQHYMGPPPSVVVTLNVSEIQRFDTDAEVVSVWNGRVLVPNWERNEVVFECEPLLASLAQLGPRRHFQRPCPHVLYGPGCGVDRDDHEEDVGTDFELVDDTTVYCDPLAGFSENYFAGGYLTYTNSVTGIPEYRAIRSSAFGDLRVSWPIAGLDGSTDLKIFPGCNHTPTDCTVKFNNFRRYGGQLNIPSTSPFAGKTLY